MHQVMRSVGLGTGYRRWLHTLYQVPKESLPAYMQADPCFAPHQDGDLGDPAPPITRQVKVNGRLSEPIVLERGVAQGCPLSCLLFVLTVEIFHQMVRDDPLLPGIRLPQLPTSHHRHPGPRPPQARAVSSGFADDSALYVENMGPQ